MAANRIPGIRAGLCHDTYSAHQGVEHDDMNVLVLGGRVVGRELARELIHAFLSARFSGEDRHLRRLAKVTALANPLRALQVFGQSVWLDYIRRSLITSGELRRLIDDDGLRGVTSNPAIFEKAVAGSSDYTEMLEAPAARDADAKSLYEALAVRDIQEAADVLRPVYERTARRDGYVSLEVSPVVARDTAGTVEEARRLWRAVGARQPDDQDPGHRRRASPRSRQLIGEGINVNVTLLFGCDTYERRREAYIAGLERLAARGGDLARVAAWRASWSAARHCDRFADRRRAGRRPRTPGSRAPAGADRQGRDREREARYQRYRRSSAARAGRPWPSRGAQTQRLLWASTGTKNRAVATSSTSRS